MTNYFASTLLDGFGKIDFHLHVFNQINQINGIALLYPERSTKEAQTTNQTELIKEGHLTHHSQLINDQRGQIDLPQSIDQKGLNQNKKVITKTGRVEESQSNGLIKQA